MRDIKLVVCDCDGTILHEDKSFDDDLKEVAEKLKEQDIMFTINTGRNINDVKWIVDHFEIDVPYVLDNGSNVYLNDDRIINHQISKDNVEYIVNLLMENDLPFLMMSDDAIYYYKETAYFDKFIRRVREHIPFRDVETNTDYRNEDVYKIMADAFFCRNIEELGADVESKCNEVVFRRSENKMYSITNARANKYEGVKHLCEYHNISEDQVMVFGDNYNDIQMLEHIEESVVMENAADMVKEKAKYVTVSNDSNGVSRFLKVYFNLV